jgi:hypothetical protein
MVAVKWMTDLNELFTKALGSLSVFFDDLCKIEQATGCESKMMSFQSAKNEYISGYFADEKRYSPRQSVTKAMASSPTKNEMRWRSNMECDYGGCGLREGKKKMSQSRVLMTEL